MGAILWLIHTVIELIVLILVVNAVLSWLIAFDVVNKQNRAVNAIWDFTNRLTEPLLRPIRKVIPLIGGVDLSPLVLILGLLFLERLLAEVVFRAGLGV
jgi:YggT family protein